MIALFMAIVMCICLAGCGKTMCSVEGCKNEVADNENEVTYCDKHLAENVYDSLKNAYEISARIGNDIIAAWRTGIYDTAAFQSKDYDTTKISILAAELSLSQYDVEVGAAAAYQLMWNGVLWANMTEEEKEESLNPTSGMPDGEYALRLQAYGDLFQFCVTTVIEGYTHNGQMESAQTSLLNAKDWIRLLGDTYPDYVHYAALLDYYTSVSSYLEFCQSPSGNFEQASNSNNAYQNDVKEYVNKLELVFGE